MDLTVIGELSRLMCERGWFPVQSYKPDVEFSKDRDRTRDNKPRIGTEIKKEPRDVRDEITN